MNQIQLNADATQLSGQSGTEPPEADIRAQLQRILASPDFAVPERSRRLLDYVVTETLAGRATRLKAYSIATEVLGRADDFDPQRDPIVRIEAARLRRELEHYYLTTGHADPIIVSIPKGGYVPSFTSRLPAAPLEPPATASPGQSRNLLLLALAAFAALVTLFYVAMELPKNKDFQDGRPQIVVRKIVPDQPAHADTAAAMTTDIIQQLAQRSDLVSVEVGSGDGARYELTGTVEGHAQGEITLEAQVTERGTGAVIWAGRYDFHKGPRDESQRDAAEQLAKALADPYGEIFQVERKKLSADLTTKSSAYACKVAYYSYRAGLSPEDHPHVRQCLESVAETDSDDATIFGMLSLVTSDEIRYGYSPPSSKSQPALERALEAARTSVKLDPNNARGTEAMMVALTFAGDTQAALELGRKGIERHPDDLELLGEYGHRLALSGQWTDGCSMVQRVQDAGNQPPTYFQAILSLCGYFLGDLNKAADLIQQGTGTANPFHHVIAAAIFGELGDTNRSAQEVAWLQKNAADLLKVLRRELSFRIKRPEDSQRFLASLSKAGLSLPE